jgi:hypothetical protein|nr:MAG TPA: hypothetical protein [Caudoviricetes sp.]
MALTQEELDQILNAIKASSQDLKSLVVVSNLDGLNSLPAIKGDSLVLVPLDLIQSKSANITVVAEYNDKLTLRTHGFELQDGDKLCLLRYITSRGHNVSYTDRYYINKKGWIKTSITSIYGISEEKRPYIDLPFSKTVVYQATDNYCKYVIELSAQEILRGRINISESYIRISNGRKRREIFIGDQILGMCSVVYGIAVYRGDSRISNIAPFKVVVDARNPDSIRFFYGNLPQ